LTPPTLLEGVFQEDLKKKGKREIERTSKQWGREGESREHHGDNQWNEAGEPIGGTRRELG